jgi:hypothetical protein
MSANNETDEELWERIMKFEEDVPSSPRDELIPVLDSFMVELRKLFLHGLSNWPDSQCMAYCEKLNMMSAQIREKLGVPDAEPGIRAADYHIGEVSGQGEFLGMADWPPEISSSSTQAVPKPPNKPPPSMIRIPIRRRRPGIEVSSEQLSRFIAQKRKRHNRSHSSSTSSSSSSRKSDTLDNWTGIAQLVEVPASCTCQLELCTCHHGSWI